MATPSPSILIPSIPSVSSTVSLRRTRSAANNNSNNSSSGSKSATGFGHSSPTHMHHDEDHYSYNDADAQNDDIMTDDGSEVINAVVQAERDLLMHGETSTGNIISRNGNSNTAENGISIGGTRSINQNTSFVLRRRNARLMRAAEEALKGTTEENEETLSRTISGSLLGLSPRWYRDRDLLAFASMTGLTASFMIVELIVGVTIHSLALQADAFHMASDVVALLVGFMAMRVTKQSKYNRSSSKNDGHRADFSYGMARMEVVGSLVNGVFLLAVCLQILLEALQRLIMINSDNEATVEEGQGSELMLIVGGVGLGINILGLIMFSHGSGGGHGHSHGGGHGHGGGGGGGHGHGGGGGNDHGKLSTPTPTSSLSTSTPSDIHVSIPSSTPAPPPSSHGHSHGGGHGHSHGHSHGGGVNMNIRGVFLHVLGDALGSIAVIISGCIIQYSNLPYKHISDPLCSLAIVCIVGFGTFPMVRHAIAILLQRVPSHVNIHALKTDVLAVDGVLSVHDMHVWALTEGTAVASLHVLLDRRTPSWRRTVDSIKVILHNSGIHASTVQPEFVSKRVQEQLEAAALAVAAAATTVATSSPIPIVPSLFVHEGVNIDGNNIESRGIETIPSYIGTTTKEKGTDEIFSSSTTLTHPPAASRTSLVPLSLNNTGIISNQNGTTVGTIKSNTNNNHIDTTGITNGNTTTNHSTSIPSASPPSSTSATANNSNPLVATPHAQYLAKLLAMDACNEPVCSEACVDSSCCPSTPERPGK